MCCLFFFLLLGFGGGLQESWGIHSILIAVVSAMFKCLLPGRCNAGAVSGPPISRGHVENFHSWEVHRIFPSASLSL